MKDMKFYTLEEIEDKYIGEKGTPKRDKYEADLHSFLIGEAIKQARQSKNLTFATISRVFKAMGISAKLEIGNLGKVALW